MVKPQLSQAEQARQKNKGWDPGKSNMAIRERIEDRRLQVTETEVCRQAGRQSQRDLLSAGSLPKHPQQPGPCKAKVRILEFDSGVPRGWQELKYLNCQLVPSDEH